MPQPVHASNWKSLHAKGGARLARDATQIALFGAAWTASRQTQTARAD
jgi:hypothetical protein